MGQTEGHISEWLVEEGTKVEKGQMIMVMETEKVAYELESSDEGYIVFQVDLHQVVPCDTTVAMLAETKDELTELLSKKQTSPHPEGPRKVDNPPSEKVPDSSARDEFRATSLSPERRRLITPVAKKKCKIHDLDISKIKGTGPNGRIQNRDVEKVLNQRRTSHVHQEFMDKNKSALRIKASIPFSGMRKAIADNVMNSLRNSAQLSWSAEIDVTDVFAWRKKWNDELADDEDKISVNDIMVYVLAKAIKKVPQVNAALVGDEIKIWEDIHVGMAVATEIGEYDHGLVVPVLRNAGEKTLIEISRESRYLIEKARSGQLNQMDLQGGTITISNSGSLGPGWRIATPVLVYPQAVLIQPSGAEDRPVVRHGEIVVRTMIAVSFTFDHRILDAVPMYKLYARMKELLENPELLIL